MLVMYVLFEKMLSDGFEFLFSINQYRSLTKIQRFIVVLCSFSMRLNPRSGCRYN